MLIDVYAVRDGLTGFGMPVLRDNDAVASRAFDFDCKREDSPYRFHPADFALYKLGSYDSDNGVITPVTPEFICSASDFIRKE